MLLIEDKSLTTEDFSYLKKDLDQQLMSLNRFLDNLLHWSNSQMQGYTLTQKTVLNLHELVQHNFQLVKEIAAYKKIKLNNEIAQALIILSDENQIDLILRNLISNALKFTPIGGEIRIAAEDSAQYIQIKVSDNGIGITKEKMDVLFQSQINKSSIGTIGENGTGLGLLLCKEFAEKHGGKLWVESEMNKGSTFYFTLIK